jgi:hypothetical protein
MNYQELGRVMTMTDSKRPKSLTLIAWILIIVSLFYFANAILEPKYRVTSASRILPFLWLIISGVMDLVSGSAILKGFNWGRLLCLYYIPVSITGYILISIWLIRFHPIKFAFIVLVTVVAIAFYVITIVSLTRPASLAFFTHSSSEE